MNFAQKINELNLQAGTYVVVGSGILNALGIRESEDVDLVVTEDAYQMLNEKGWEHGEWRDQPVLRRDVFDIGRHWYGKGVKELLKTAQVVDGIPYLSLDDVYEWKKGLGREKDIRDIALIDEYRKSNIAV